MSVIKVWAGNPAEKNRPLADSVHFAIRKDAETWENWNLGYGILYAAGRILEDNTIEERSLRNPSLMRMGEEYGILAECIDLQGRQTECEELLLWKTKDFVEFDEGMLVKRADYPEYEKGCVQELEIPEKLIERIRRRWLPIQSVSVTMPDEIVLSEVKQLQEVRAQVNYNDGSCDWKKVVWDDAALSGCSEGTCEVTGMLKEQEYLFPLTTGHGDPVLFFWKDAWYYIATSDNTDDVGLFVRKAKSPEALFAPGIEEYCILDRNEEKDWIQTFWAPEFHVIGGELYLLFALGGREWSPQSHIMKLKKDGEICRAEDWEEPVRIRKKDGSLLAEDAITLDMTFFRGEQASYYVWSWRKHIGTPMDTGSMLFIAEVKEENPYQLASEPVLLSRPLYNWENRERTINNEGPYPLILGDTIYLLYSGGSANGESYAVGYLKADRKADLLEPRAWKKAPAPVMFSGFVPGVFGPGHNSVYRDEDGKLWNAYHAKQGETEELRCSAISRIHLDQEGHPVFAMSPEQDLREDLKKITVKVKLLG